MTEPVAHAADVAPGLARHQRARVRAKPVRRLAHPLQAALNRIAHAFAFLRDVAVGVAEARFVQGPAAPQLAS